MESQRAGVEGFLLFLGQTTAMPESIYSTNSRHSSSRRSKKSEHKAGASPSRRSGEGSRGHSGVSRQESVARSSASKQCGHGRLVSNGSVRSFDRESVSLVMPARTGHSIHINRSIESDARFSTVSLEAVHQRHGSDVEYIEKIVEVPHKTIKKKIIEVE